MNPRTTVSAAALAMSLMAGLAAADTALPPQSSNAALRYWMAFALLQDPPEDKATAELIERVASAAAPWDELRLGPILDANREAIEGLQRGTRLPGCDWGVEYELGPAAPIAHLAKARVLARLNTLAGMRLAARGRPAEAIDVWLTGVRFSQHVAQGGSLISVLTGRAALTSSLRALGQSLATTPAEETRRQRIEGALRALPETGFDWSQAMQREEAAVEVAVQQLSRARDPKTFYQSLTGRPAPERFSVPTASDVAGFRRLMTRAAEMLRLAPDRARQGLKDLEAAEQTLHPFFQQAIPSLSRINDTRTEVLAERQKLLQSVASPR